MKIGETIEGRIDRTEIDGHGVLVHDGIALGIPGVIAGDVVRVRVEHLSRHAPRGWAKIERVLSRSPDFVDPVCPHAWPVSGRCGGCPLMHLAPPAYNELKTQWTLDALSSILQGIPFEWHRAPQSAAYRNRCNYVPTQDKQGQIVLGSYAPRSHDVADMAGCKVVRPAIASLASRLGDALSKFNVPLFPAPGGLRYLTVRALNTAQTLVDLIVEAADAPWLEPFSRQVYAWEDVAGVSYSSNPVGGNALRVADSQSLFGEFTGIERVGDVELELSASSFSQANTTVAETMYDRVRPLVREGDIIWDLYCGVGSLGLSLVTAVDRVVIHGAESVPSAVELADKNAKRNKRTGNYQVVDLTAPDLTGWPNPNLILVNPPRRGLDHALLPWLEQATADRLIYMSCNPISFARDVHALAESSWRLAQVDAYDMLPMSGHVELIASFL